MGIEHRIEKLEEQVVVSPEAPIFLIRQAGSELTEEAIENAKKTVMGEHPCQSHGQSPDRPVYLLRFNQSGTWVR